MPVHTCRSHKSVMHWPNQSHSILAHHGMYAIQHKQCMEDTTPEGLDQATLLPTPSHLYRFPHQCSGLLCLFALNAFQLGQKLQATTALISSINHTMHHRLCTTYHTVISTTGSCSCNCRRRLDCQVQHTSSQLEGWTKPGIQLTLSKALCKPKLNTPVDAVLTERQCNANISTRLINFILYHASG